MPIYPDPVAGYLGDLKHSGEVGDANATGRAVNFECGGFVAIDMRVSDDDGTVADISFRSNGCGYMVVAADLVCSTLREVSLGELQGLENIEDIIRLTFGMPPAGRSSCFVAVADAVRASFADHRRRRIEEFSGEKALICTCFGISEETVIEFIENFRPATLDEVSRVCRAGSGCGSCRMLIQELLDVYGREPFRGKPD